MFGQSLQNRQKQWQKQQENADENIEAYEKETRRKLVQLWRMVHNRQNWSYKKIPTPLTLAEHILEAIFESANYVISNPFSVIGVPILLYVFYQYSHFLVQEIFFGIVVPVIVLLIEGWHALVKGLSPFLEELLGGIINSVVYIYDTISHLLFGKSFHATNIKFTAADIDPEEWEPFWSTLKNTKKLCSPYDSADRIVWMIWTHVTSKNLCYALKKWYASPVLRWLPLVFYQTRDFVDPNVDACHVDDVSWVVCGVYNAGYLAEVAFYLVVVVNLWTVAYPLLKLFYYIYHSVVKAACYDFVAYIHNHREEEESSAPGFRTKVALFFKKTGSNLPFGKDKEVMSSEPHTEKQELSLPKKSPPPPPEYKKPKKPVFKKTESMAGPYHRHQAENRISMA